MFFLCFFFFWGGGVITKLDYFVGSFRYILGQFKVKIQNGDIFETVKKSFFSACLIFLIYLG